MKKIVSLLVISMFLLSGAVLASVNTTKTTMPANENVQTTGVKTIEKTIHFSNPSIAEDGKYITISTENSNSVLKSEEYPMLPCHTETMEFPVGTKIVSVDVQHSEPKEMKLSKKIVPTPVATPFNMKNVKTKVVEGNVYSSNNDYPNSWDRWNVGVGLDGTKHVFYLSLQLYPVTYNAGKSTLNYVNDMDVKVSYIPSAKPLVKNDVYDLLIIAPSEFKDALQPLVDHKESHG
ncbi:MAG: hypothetical protein GWP10_21190, partial [Nitrospiraceae bacterium]|nr:hypothetical protein [Nitrospiraceae bacterium]